MSAIVGRYGRAREAVAQAEPARPPVIDGACAACGRPKERADWVACVACLVGRFDEAAVARLAEERDALATWIVDAEAVLSALPPDDPRRVRGEAIWRQKLKSYQALCHLVPEPRA